MLPLRIGDTLLNELRIEKHNEYKVFERTAEADFIKIQLMIKYGIRKQDTLLQLHQASPAKFELATIQH